MVAESRLPVIFQEITIYDVVGRRRRRSISADEVRASV